MNILQIPVYPHSNESINHRRIIFCFHDRQGRNLSLFFVVFFFLIIFWASRRAHKVGIDLALPLEPP